jgi:hypothetical protein
MHVFAVESGARLLFLTGMADGNGGDGDDRCGQLKNLLELPDAVFPRVDPQPAGAQAQTMRAQQQILDAAQTTIPSAAVASMPPLGKAAAMVDNISFFRMTTKRQGSLATAEGAAMAACNSWVMAGSLTSPGA